MTKTVQLGDLEIAIEKLANGKCRVVVSGKMYGLETLASDDDVRDVAKQLTKLVDERERVA